jgi:hypothetical protein
MNIDHGVRNSIYCTPASRALSAAQLLNGPSHARLTLCEPLFPAKVSTVSNSAFSRILEASLPNAKMSATADFYLNALLALSGNAPLAAARRTLLRSMSDDDLSHLLSRGMGCEFARGAMEGIVLLMLDIIARDPDTPGVKVARSSIARV